MTLARHTLILDAFQPHRLNVLLRLHWAARNRALKGDADVVAAEAFRQGIPKAAGKRRVSLTVRHGRSVKAADADALWKSLLDALVKCGLLLDDDPAHCELGTVGYETAERRGLVVLLEDLEGG